MSMARLITHVARPLRFLDERSTLLERLVETPLSNKDATAIRQACGLSGKCFGEFYHWYLQKLLVSRAIRKMGRSDALSLISSVDGTDYSQLTRITAQPAGVLVAIPHHGHYIFSIIQLAENLRHFRRVYVFYGQPSTHRGNEIFDSLHSVIWRHGDGVEVIHDTRQGMAKAIRALKNGDVVVIMPDVFTHESATFVVPFVGRPMQVMLGTATLARKAGAWVMPAVAKQHGRGLGFRTWFGKGIDASTCTAAIENAKHARIVDYRTTRELFNQYEAVMTNELLYWQFVRQHMSMPEGYEAIARSDLKSVVKLLAKDPFLLGAAQTVDIRT